jgi:drug/metabolite transporter (DMT)-like permease
MNKAIAPQALHRRGVLLLLVTTLIWGTSFPLLKHVITSLSPAVLVAIRFSVAAIAVAPWLRRLNASLIRDGIVLGVIYFVETCITLVGLETISANRSAFIISLNVILVPLLSVGLGRRLPAKILVAAGLALLGIGVMSWEGGGFSQGDLLTLLGAVGVAVYILVLEATTARHSSLPLVAIQLLTMATLGMIWALPQFIEQVTAIASNFHTLLYLALVVTVTPTWTQAVAQRWVSAHEAALLYTLEPVFAAK